MTTALAMVYETMPPSGGGGCAPRGDAFARAAAAHGAFGPITVYTTSENPSPIERVNLHSVGGSSVEPQRLVTRLSGELMFGLRVAAQVFRSSRGTLWLISTPSYVAMLIVAFAVRLRGARYALDIRDIYPQAFIAAGLLKPNGLLAKLASQFSRQAYAGATATLAATDGLTRTLRSIAPSIPVHTVLNGFIANRGNLDVERRERFTVCFHGVLGFFQDSQSLLEVGKRLEAHGIDLVVIGYGRDAVLFDAPGASNIHFLGRLPYDQTMLEVARCHVGLSLRKQEEISADSFPVKVWEYLGLGLPTIVSPPSDAGEFVSRHGCGYVLEAGDIDGVVTRIVELRDDAKLYETMSATALIAVAPYSRDAQAKKMASELAGTAVKSGT